MKPIMQNGYLSHGDIRSLESDLENVDLNKKGIKDWVVNEVVFSASRNEESFKTLMQILKEEL